MVMLYVDGEQVGTVTDLEKLLAELVARNRTVELRDGSGNPLGTFRPHQASGPLVPWDPTITQADLDRIASEPGFTFDEVKRRLGWE